MIARSIEVVPYDPLWPTQFETLKSGIWPVVSDLATSVEHVGSTSVPGLCAKPIIDLDIVIPSQAELPEVIKRLAALGYEHQGNFGIEGRESFRGPADSLRHHLYVCPAKSLALRNHVTFRDHLRTNLSDRDTYAQLKMELAQQFSSDIDAYTEGKSEFILTILARYDFEGAQLDEIRLANS